MATVTWSRSLLCFSPRHETWSRSLLCSSGKIVSSKSLLCQSLSKIEVTRSLFCFSGDKTYETTVTTRKDYLATVTAYIGNTQILNIYSFSWSCQKNNAARWSCSIDGSTGQQTLLFPDVFSSNFTLLASRKFSMRITVGGVTTYIKDLIIQDYNWEGSPQGGYTINFSGTDKSLLLCRDNQSHSSWKSTGTTTYYMKQIMEDILDHYIQYQYEIDDNIKNDWNYPVLIFHMPSIRPIDAINKLLYVIQGEWYVTKLGKFRIRKYNSSPIDLTPKRTYLNLHYIQYKRSSSGLINQIDVRRTVSTGFLGAESEGYQYGFYTVNFSGEAGEQGLLGVSQVTIANFGNIPSNLVYAFGELGCDIKGSVALLSAATFPVKSISFRFDPPDAHPEYAVQTLNGELFPYFHVWFRGKLPVTAFQTTFSSEFAVRVENTTSINKYGVIPCSQVEEDPLIPNETWAKKHGEQIIDESGRNIETCVISIPIDPDVEVGDLVAFVESVSGLSNRVFRVEGVSLSYSPSDISCELSLVRYLADV